MIFLNTLRCQMELEIKETIEHEDGSATLFIDMDEKTKTYLINLGLIQCIERGLTEVKEMHEKYPFEEPTL